MRRDKRSPRVPACEMCRVCLGAKVHVQVRRVEPSFPSGLQPALGKTAAVVSSPCKEQLMQPLNDLGPLTLRDVGAQFECLGNVGN